MPPPFVEVRMPAKRIPMQQIKEVLRLHHEAKLAYSQIALACGLSNPTSAIRASVRRNSLIC